MITMRREKLTCLPGKQSCVFDIRDLDKPFGEADKIKMAQKLKGNTSPGAYMILNEYIKASIDQLMPLYVHLFNKVLDTGNVPDSWLIGKIIYRFKGMFWNLETTGVLLYTVDKRYATDVV